MAATTMMEIIKDGNNSPELDERMTIIAAGNIEYHSSLEDMRAPLWPVPRILH
ncbi:hypothetical protein [uncultured Gordonia sp.]|uniref:hypothetical protein n=1 Tax=uncultured Gordonia sp. TaxID=198437 RepID=UPI002585C64B|nr:hypothetical protein [uncultured Gordonia sp.]